MLDGSPVSNQPDFFRKIKLVGGRLDESVNKPSTTTGCREIRVQSPRFSAGGGEKYQRSGNPRGWPENGASVSYEL
jgi:hypothetical protein